MKAYDPDYLNNTFVLNNELKDRLAQLNEQKPLSLLDNDSLYQKLAFDFIYTSSQIEGNTYDKIDTMVLIEDGQTAGGKAYRDAVMILNLRRAMDQLQFEGQPVSASLIKDYHKILSHDLLPLSEQGIVRQSGVYIQNTDYKPIERSEQLKTELKYLINTTHKITNPFEKALYLHNNLAYLQYFRDVNKRTARLMLNVCLKHEGQCLYFPQEKDIKAYKSAMIHYYETGDHAAFALHFVDTIEHTVEALLFKNPDIDRSTDNTGKLTNAFQKHNQQAITASDVEKSETHKKKIKLKIIGDLKPF